MNLLEFRRGVEYDVPVKSISEEAYEFTTKHPSGVRGGMEPA